MEGASSLLYSWLCTTSECRNRLWGMTTAPKMLITTSMLPSGRLGTTHERTASPHSTSTKNSSYRNDRPMVRLAASSIDFERGQVIKGGQCIQLTAKEYAILRALERDAGKIVSIDALCEAAWGDNPFGYENSLMAHIRRIREKIEENPSRPVSLITVKGLGYKLVSEG